MPRNGSGTYSLPAGNPVVSGTTIQSTWANSTLNDVGDALTGSVARDGTGGMSGPLRLADGTISIPGIAFSSETTTGFSRPTTNAIVASVSAVERMRINASGVSVSGALSATSIDINGNVTLSGGTANGVVYLNGSKVATSGSALTFDGTTLVQTVGDGNVSSRWIAASGRMRLRPYVDATIGALLETINTAESARIPFTLAGSTFKVVADTTQTFSTANVDRMTLDASGNVGIGTASPTFGSGTGVEIERAGIATLRLENSSASNSFELYADTAANGINLRGRDSSPMLLWTANTERMRIAANGAIGIGGANYGTSGQVLTSAGSGAAPSWSALPSATATAQGIVELATSAETQTGTDTTRAVTPAGFSAASIGYGQTWQDVTGSRAFGTTYTNSTGKPIFIVVTGTTPSGANGAFTLTIGGVIVAENGIVGNGGNSGQHRIPTSAIVPPGSTYSAQQSVATSTLDRWVELR